jgi:hypothetical protein
VSLIRRLRGLGRAIEQQGPVVECAWKNALQDGRDRRVPPTLRFVVTDSMSKIHVPRGSSPHICTDKNGHL